MNLEIEPSNQKENLHVEIEMVKAWFHEFCLKLKARGDHLGESPSAEFTTFYGREILKALADNVLCLYPSDLDPALDTPYTISLSRRQ